MILCMFVIINEPILLHYYYLLHSDYMSFYLRYHITFSWVPLGFSWLWQFLRLSCFSMWFCRIPSTGIFFSLYWNLFDVCLMVRLNLWFTGEKTATIKYFCHIILRHTISMIYHCWYCPWSPGSDICHCKVTHWLFIFSYCTLWKEVTTQSSHFKSGICESPSWGGRIYIN